MEYKKYELEGYNLHVLKTDKFKTTQIALRFKGNMDRQTVTSRSLLPFVLKAKTDKYSSKKAISTKLEELFGASFGAKVAKYGKCNIVSFDMRIVNERFLHKGGSLLEEACLFINDIIMNHSTIEATIVEEEKRLLEIEFEEEKNNKTRYALGQLYEIMLENEPYRIKALGVREDLADITEADIQEAYNDLINNNEIDVIVCGDLTEQQVETLKTIFTFKGVKREVPIIDTEDKTIESVHIKEEVIDVSQGKLNIGFRTRTRIGDTLEAPMMVYNQILGGGSNSKLFENVREKHSLCYYCASGLDLNKGLMYIYAGIESDKYHDALPIIREQLAAMVKGDFTEDAIDESKKTILNDYFEALDSQGSLVTKAYSDTIKNLPFDIDRVVTKISAVTKEQIVEAAKLIEEDSIFFLSNKAVVL